MHAGASQWKARFKRYGRLAGALLVLVGVVLAARTVPIFEWVDQISAPLREMGWLGVGLYALIFFAAGMLCIPCSPLTLASGYILGSTLKGVIAVQTGVTLAAAAGYLLGQWLGRRRAAEWMRRSPRFHQIDDAIAEEGWKIVGMLRMHAIPFGVSNYLYGMTKIDFWHYMLATFVAMLPGHIIYVHIGAVGGRHLSGQGSIGPLELIAAAFGIISLVGLGYLLNRMVKKHKERQRTAAERAG